MTTQHKPFQLGSVSQGTLKPEDLLPAFRDKLAEFDHAMTDQWDDLFDEADDLMEYWVPTESQIRKIPAVVDRLADALHGVCPPFVYFGTLEGDGADFGFWPDYDAIQEEIEYHRPHREFWLDENQCFLSINCEEQVTCYDSDHNLLWSTV